MDGYYDDAVSFDSLYRGMKGACRNVRWKDSVTGYEANGMKNTLALRRDLLSGRYRIAPYQRFTIYEPKRREIVATRMRDRQFQRALCDSGLYEDIVEHLIRDNCACQTGRGTDDALNRMKLHLRRHYRKHGNAGWVLKCDVHHFFASIDHEVARTAVRRYVSDERAADRVCEVIDSFDCGLGLGSQISQLVALLVLNGLDHEIKERMHVEGYVRYMDDFVLVSDSKEHLRWCLGRIRSHLAGIGLELNGKTQMFPLRHGVRFLQWRFVLTDTGKVLMLMDKRKCARQRKRVKKMLRRERDGTLPPGTARRSMEAWTANAEKGDTHRTVRAMQEWFERTEAQL